MLSKRYMSFYLLDLNKSWIWYNAIVWENSVNSIMYLFVWYFTSFKSYHINQGKLKAKNSIFIAIFKKQSLALLGPYEVSY